MFTENRNKSQVMVIHIWVWPVPCSRSMPSKQRRRRVWLDRRPNFEGPILRVLWVGCWQNTAFNMAEKCLQWVNGWRKFKNGNKKAIRWSIVASDLVLNQERLHRNAPRSCACVFLSVFLLSRFHVCTSHLFSFPGEFASQKPPRATQWLSQHSAKPLRIHRWCGTNATSADHVSNTDVTNGFGRLESTSTSASKVQLQSFRLRCGGLLKSWKFV